jgi:hypothetical protein
MLKGRTKALENRWAEVKRIIKNYCCALAYGVERKYR